jgi:hypothetical protein
MEIIKKRWNDKDPKKSFSDNIKEPIIFSRFYFPPEKQKGWLDNKATNSNI